MSHIRERAFVCHQKTEQTGYAGDPEKDTLERHLALLKLRELRRAGMSYREIGRRYGAARRRAAGGRVRVAPGPGGTAAAPRTADAAAFLRALDALEDGLALVDGRGALLHANRALRRLLEGGAAGERLRAELVLFAGSLWALVRLRGLNGSGAVEALASRDLPPGGERRRMTGSYLGLDLLGAGPSVLISVEAPPADPLPAEALALHFGLSPQEARIARLLAEGWSNREIAHRLSISPHTARHHTGRILRKLGAGSRAEAAARLLRGGPETDCYKR